MKKKGMIDRAIDSGRELLKEGEQFIEDTTEADIDIFTDHNTSVEATHEKVKQDLLDLEGSIILDNIKTKLVQGFLEFKKNTNNSLLISSEKKKEYIKEAKKQYDELKTILDGYHNDGDFKEGYDKVNGKISKWLKVLESKGSHDIVNKARMSLEILQADMLSLKSKSKSEIESEKAKIKQKHEKSGNEEENQIKIFLTKIGLPAGLVGVAMWFLGKIGFIGKDKQEDKGFFGKMFDFMKNPVDGLLGFIGLGNDEKKDKEKTSASPENTENIVNKGEIKESSNILTYTNEKIKIIIDNKKISSIKIDNIDYKFNLDILEDITIIQLNGKDYLKIGEKNIDLFKLVNESRTSLEKYDLYKDFLDNKDLKLIKTGT